MGKAILVIRIDEVESLALNEFFDYNGHCYALTCGREHMDEFAIDMEDFYDETIGTAEIDDVDVYFITCEKECVTLYGWYKNATIYRKIMHPSMFLEGNVVASAGEVMLLEKPVVLQEFEWYVGKQHYEVVEKEDSRYRILSDWKDTYKGKNIFARFPYIHISMDTRITKSFPACIRQCEVLAQQIMEDTCGGIYDLAMLRAYAQKATELDRKNADGYYYLAMANYHLGLLKEAMKAIEKANKLEPEASDILAQKAGILASMGYKEEAGKLFHRAYELSGDEEYVNIELS